MCTKNLIKEELEKVGINAIIIIDISRHIITAIIQNKEDCQYIDSILHDSKPVGILVNVRVDISLICDGVCFTEINFLPEIKKSFFSKLKFWK